MSPEPAQENLPVEWCRGLTLTGHRALSVEETIELKTEVQSLRRSGCLSGCAFPLIFITPFFAFSIFYDFNRTDETGATIAVFSLLLLLIPAALLLLRSSDASKRSKGLQGDLKSNYVKRFEGSAGDFEGQIDKLLAPNLSHVDPQQNESQQASDFTRPDSPLWIEVLPVSHRLWKINGRPCAQWTEASWAAVAPQPEAAKIAAKWMPRVTLSAEQFSVDQPLPHNLRNMSEAEKVELEQFSRRLWKRPLWPAIILNAWLGVPLIVSLSLRLPITMEPMAYVLIALTAWVDFNLISGILKSRQLMEDRQEGTVVIVRLPEGPATAQKVHDKTADSDATGPSSIDSGGPIMEVLPFSQALWTENGQPAAWRKVPN